MKQPLRFFRPAKFCFCIPIRVGVFGLAIFGLGIGGLVGVTAWLQVAQLGVHPLDQMDLVALIVHSIFFSALAAWCLLGFACALMQKRLVAIIYLYGQLILLFAGIASGAFAIVAMYTPNSPKTIERCLHGATDATTRQVCNNGLAIMKGVAITVYAATWLLLIYSAMITFSFIYQIRDADSEAARGRTVKPLPDVNKEDISHPAPLTMYNSFGAPGRNNGYAFSSVGVKQGVDSVL